MEIPNMMPLYEKIKENKTLLPSLDFIHKLFFNNPLHEKMYRNLCSLPHFSIFYRPKPFLTCPCPVVIWQKGTN